MKSKFFQFFFLFFIIFFTLQLLGVGQTPEEEISKEDIVLALESKSVTIGSNVRLTIKNNLSEAVTVPSDCPREPLDVYKYDNGTWNQLSAENEYVPCKEMAIAAGETMEIDYGKWKKDLFQEEGKYKVELPLTINDEEKTFFSEFEIVPPGFLKNIWDKLFYKPIYNTLIFLIASMPISQNLALSIILLTILIKIILLIPNNRAIRAQRDLQKVQPHLEEIKNKYKGDQKKIAEETMKVWKEHKVNPFGSCLPLLIQFPVMIALFYVVKDGLNIDENTHLLYDFLRNKDIFIDPWFLWVLDLTKNNLYVLPVIVGGLQFIQMKSTFARQKKTQKSKDKSDMQNQMQTMNATMQYILPIMIAVFTASLPAAVGLYWGISTVFAIGQQYVVNRKGD